VSLEESDAFSRGLLYSVSHELPTPLRAIWTVAVALQSSDLDADLRDAMLADLHRKAGRLTRLVSNLLEASRVEAGALGIDLPSEGARRRRRVGRAPQRAPAPARGAAERQRILEAFQRLREQTANADRSGSVGRTPDLRDGAVA
jgi:signal transduction histidine kinase